MSILWVVNNYVHAIFIILVRFVIIDSVLYVSSVAYKIDQCFKLFAYSPYVFTK